MKDVLMLSDLKLKYEGNTDSEEVREAEEAIQENTAEEHYPAAPFELARPKSNKGLKRKWAKHRRRSRKSEAVNRSEYYKTKQHRTHYTYDMLTKAEAKQRDEARETKAAIEGGYFEYRDQLAEAERIALEEQEEAERREFDERVSEIKDDPTALGILLRENLGDMTLEYLIGKILLQEKVWID